MSDMKGSLKGIAKGCRVQRLEHLTLNRTVLSSNPKKGIP